MATTHILAVGCISKGHTSLRVAPHTPEAAAQLDAYLEESLGKPQLTDCVSMVPFHDPDFVPDWQAFQDYVESEVDDYEEYQREIEWLRSWH